VTQLDDSQEQAKRTTRSLVEPPRKDQERPRAGARIASRIFHESLSRYSGLCMLGAVILMFSLWMPHIFPTRSTLTAVLADQSTTGLLALGAMIPLAAGAYDIAFGNVAGLSLVLIVWMSTHTGINDFLLAGIAIAAGGVFGALSGVLISRLKVNSLIVTLGVSSVALGLGEWLSGGNTLNATFAQSFLNLGQTTVGPIPIPDFFLAGLALVVYVYFEHLPGGRHLLATGENEVAARLVGLRINRIRFLALVTSGVVAGLAGVLLASEISSASTSTGEGLLLAPFAAIFLGTTQIKSRVNVAGTLVAVFLLGTLIEGLELLGAANWVTDFFDGVVLLIAVVLAALKAGNRVRKVGEPAITSGTSSVKQNEEVDQ
jgi:ribose transport system permease protein